MCFPGAEELEEEKGEKGRNCTCQNLALAQALSHSLSQKVCHRIFALDLFILRASWNHKWVASKSCDSILSIHKHMVHPASAI